MLNKKNVFISYETTTGLSYATNLKKALARMSISAFVANEDIPKGKPDNEVIDDAIRECTYFVVVITSAAISSDEVKREIKLANQLSKYIIPAKSYTVERTDTNMLPIVGYLEQVDFESKETLADQVVAIIVKLKRLFSSWRTSELSNIQSAVIAMMVDNNLTRLANPVVVATNDMGAFPDATSVAGSADKRSDPNGNAYQAGDKNGYILFGHDIIGDNAQTGLVNYITSRYTQGTYSVNAQGTVTQVTTGYE